MDTITFNLFKINPLQHQSNLSRLEVFKQLHPQVPTRVVLEKSHVGDLPHIRWDSCVAPEIHINPLAFFGGEKGKVACVPLVRSFFTELEIFLIRVWLKIRYTKNQIQSFIIIFAIASNVWHIPNFWADPYYCKISWFQPHP